MTNKQKLKQIIMEERKEYTKYLETYNKVPKWRKSKKKMMEDRLRAWMDKIGSLCEIYETL